MTAPAPRLTPHAVLEARARYARGDRIADIARVLGVHPSAASRAIHRVTWRHVA